MIKYFAIFAMVADHVPHFVPVSSSVQAWCMFVGRMAMPMFCYLIAAGSVRTTDFPKYLGLLLLFGLLAQPLNVIAFDREWWHPNVLLTLAFGLLATRSYLVVFLAPVLALPFEYSWPAVLTIACLAAYLRSGSSNVIPLVFAGSCAIHLNGPLIFDVPAVGALGLCLLLDSEIAQQFERCIPRGPRLLFYAFYPAHLAVLMMLAPLLG